MAYDIDPFEMTLERGISELFGAKSPTVVIDARESGRAAMREIRLGQHMFGRASDFRSQKIGRDLYENLMFQSLVPAFDDVPMKRVFPICLYTPEESYAVHAQLAVALHAVIEASRCDTVQTYPILDGSKLHRGLVRKPERQTHNQFQESQNQVAIGLAKALKDNGGITVNVNVKVEAESKPERKSWTGGFKDLTESLRNLLLVGMGATLLFDGMKVSSKAGNQSVRPEVSIMQIDRNTQLQILPDILDAEKPEDFRKIMEGLEGSAVPAKTPKTEPGKSRSR
jgi:hypothetical protein